MTIAACLYPLFTLFIGIVIGDMHAKPTKNK
jgi:thiol:disulfide interchange protein